MTERELHAAEAVGRELFGAAYDLAANRDLVDPGREEVRRRRADWAAEVRAVLRDLEEIHEADERQLREVLDGHVG